MQGPGRLSQIAQPGLPHPLEMMLLPQCCCRKDAAAMMRCHVDDAAVLTALLLPSCYSGYFLSALGSVRCWGGCVRVERSSGSSSGA